MRGRAFFMLFKLTTNLPTEKQTLTMLLANLKNFLMSRFCKLLKQKLKLIIQVGDLQSATNYPQALIKTPSLLKLS